MGEPYEQPAPYSMRPLKPQKYDYTEQDNEFQRRINEQKMYQQKLQEQQD